MAKIEPPPSAPGQDKFNLCIADANGGVVEFLVRPSTGFERIFQEYAKNKGVMLQSLRFTYEGQRVAANQTPEMLQMKHKDCIDAHIAQEGGK